MLPLARYRLHWQTITLTHLPDYAGSMLRGAFGHALRRVACLTRQKECGGCPLLATCAYSTVFSPPPRPNDLQRLSQTPAPYLVEPPPWGQRRLEPGTDWHFDIVLCGRALAELPLITLAFRQALERGIGPGDGRSQLRAIDHEIGDTYHTVYRPELGHFKEHLPTIPEPGKTIPDEIDEIALHFQTPLRLQENGRALPPNRLTALTLLMAAVRRTALIQTFHGAGTPDWDFTGLKRLASTITDEKRLEWKDWTRRSARQQKTMQLGGVVGTWVLRGQLSPFILALHLGQWLHLGKETVFGLGHYQLTHNTKEKSKNPEDPLQPDEKKAESNQAQ